MNSDTGNQISESQNSVDPSSSSQSQDAQMVGFAIEPKKDCPHFDGLKIQDLQEIFEESNKELINQPCKTCNHVGENWICLHCKEVHCSRYINKDMEKHNTNNSNDCIVFSFSDGSFWCYKCDSYITNDQIKQLQKVFSKMKHGQSEQDTKANDEIQSLSNKFLDMMLENKNKEDESVQREFSYQDLIDGLSDLKDEADNKQSKRQFKNVVFLTGAGISVSAGIPDFRTPGSGLYSQLEKYKLPFPEAIFEINYFKKNPQAFYTLSKEFLTCGSHSTISHFIIAEMNKRKRLLLNFSQNIDGLEIEAGLPANKLIQAHGHFRTAKCTNCNEVADTNVFKECAKADKVFYCASCTKGIVKPDIVFFGENLPAQFYQSTQKLKLADLVFVMGTSLKVFPFAALVDFINDKTPIVLVNRENPGIKRKNFLFLEGDIDDSIEKLLTDLKWDFPKIQRTYPAGTIHLDKQKL